MAEYSGFDETAPPAGLWLTTAMRGGEVECDGSDCHAAAPVTHQTYRQ